MSSETPIAGEPRGFCAQCGKTLTSETLRSVRGVYYCEDCLAERVVMPLPPRQEGGGGAALAAILGIVPGLGAIYNGEYFKALVHVLVFGSIIALISNTGNEPLFVPLLIAFILYMPIEAYRTAKAKAAGTTAPSLFGEHQTQLPVGPIVLILLGVFLLMDKFGILNLDKVTDFFWPVILILLGAHLLRKRLSGGTTSEAIQK
jgi:hypothetical protein